MADPLKLSMPLLSGGGARRPFFHGRVDSWGDVVEGLLGEAVRRGLDEDREFTIHLDGAWVHFTQSADE